VNREIFGGGGAGIHWNVAQSKEEKKCITVVWRRADWYNSFMFHKNVVLQSADYSQHNYIPQSTSCRRISNAPQILCSNLQQISSCIFPCLQPFIYLFHVIILSLHQQMHLLYIKIQSYIDTTYFDMSLYLYTWRPYLLVSRMQDLIQSKLTEQVMPKYLFQFETSWVCNIPFCFQCSWNCSYLSWSRNKIFTETLS